MSTRAPAPEEELRRFFGGLDDWAFLRNADPFVSFKAGGDSDLLVSDLRGAGGWLKQCVGNPIRVARRSYVVSYYFPWGHIDLATGYYWKGFLLREGRHLLRDAVVREEWPIVSPVDEAVITLLSSLLWGGFVKRRYTDLIYGTFLRDPDAGESRLTELLGNEAGSDLTKKILNCDWAGLEQTIDTTRKKVAAFHVRKNPWRSALGHLRFVGYEVALRMRPGLPEMVFKVSPDIDRVRLLPTLERTFSKFEYRLQVIDHGLADGDRAGYVARRTVRAKNGIILHLVPSSGGGRLNARHCFSLLRGDEAEVACCIRRFQQSLSATS